jgi:N6-L-threonylcarbamoyladenine synthase
MLCLGIEGTAHTIGAGVVDERCRVRSNEMSTFIPAEGGIHPREAANHHAENVVPVIEAAARAAGIGLSELDLVAFSQGPGLGPCLRTAATASRALAVSLGIPVIGVNHCIAHIEIGRGTTPAKDPVLLYVSGGNTQVIAFMAGRYRIFGETLDIGVGNMLDKFGRGMGIPFPAGPKIERMALEYGNGLRAGSGGLIPLPYSVKGMDIAFSGVLTAAEVKHREGEPLPAICYSMQETVFSMLVEVTERAMAHSEKDEVLLGGGVAANTRLRTMLERMAKDRGARMYVPERKLCVDNGAMIAWLGMLMHRAGLRMPVGKTQIRQRFRTDEVDVTWRD